MAPDGVIISSADFTSSLDTIFSMMLSMVRLMSANSLLSLFLAIGVLALVFKIYNLLK